MNSKTNLASGRRRRKTFTFLWMLVLVVLTMSLIYWEQIALLYILATLGVTALLIVVALADLGRAEQAPETIPQATDAAALGSGISSTYRPNQSASWQSSKKG